MSAEVSLRDSLAPGEQVLFRQLDQEAVLLDLASGMYFGLNDVGARTWQLIIEHGSLSRVLDVLAAEYNTEREEIERDLLALATQLVARKLAAIAPHAG